MKILFVIKEEDPIDPMGIELLSALAKRAGHETFLNVLQHQDLFPVLRRIQPDIVAYSGKTGEHNVFFEVNRAIKKLYKENIFAIMGGPHPTFNHKGIQLFGENTEEVPAFNKKDLFGKRILIEPSDLDALCIKEGDDAWVDLLDALTKGQSIDSIPNIITRANRKIYPDPLFRPRRTSLDDLPFYDRALVYDKTFLSHFPLRSFMASRGCPFHCTYCFNHEWNRSYQNAGKLEKLHNRYSVDRLIAEIQDWRRVESERGYTPTQFIKFYDDIFEFRVSPWLEEFAEKFPREVGLPFFCLLRCDVLAREQGDGSVRLNEELLLLLKKAGLKSISMSIESANSFIRENIMAREMTEKEICSAYDLVNKHHIGTFCNTILGIPAPVIPRRDNPQFDDLLHRALSRTKLSFDMAKKRALGNPAKIPGYPEQLDHLLNQVKNNPTEEMRRASVALLESLGLRYDAIDYDIQDIELNLRCKIHYAEFPRLDPYPGTVITDYTIAIGAFDGDYKRLHSSYQTTSAFQCFTPQQKRIQDNLSFLGQICMVWPWLWNCSKRYLMHLPLTGCYWFFAFFAKTWAVKRHIYPMKFNPKNAVYSAYRVSLVEYKKYFQGNRKETLGS